MNFELTEDQQSLRELARQLLEQELPVERIKAVEAEGQGFDAELWARLAETNLLGVAVPEAQGGLGGGLIELALLLQEVGRTVAPAPVLPALAQGGLCIARFGSEAQRERWLAPLAAGELLLSGAAEDAGSEHPARPATRARRDGDGWILEGTKRRVAAVGRAARVLVPAETEQGVGVFLVDPQAPGVETLAGLTSTQEPLYELVLAGARVAGEDLLGDEAARGEEAARFLHDAALAGVCATQIGVCERALEITTDHLREREQFGAPIGSFPAVQQRAADAYIDLEALRWTAWRAIWRLDQGLPADRELAVAKFWTADAGARIAATAQHQHGGLGVDLDYPIHRYFLWSKALELRLGAATPQLARLGQDMARTGPMELQ